VSWESKYEDLRGTLEDHLRRRVLTAMNSTWLHRNKDAVPSIKIITDDQIIVSKSSGKYSVSIDVLDPDEDDTDIDSEDAETIGELGPGESFPSPLDALLAFEAWALTDQDHAQANR